MPLGEPFSPGPVCPKTPEVLRQVEVVRELLRISARILLSVFRLEILHQRLADEPTEFLM